MISDCPVNLYCARPVLRNLPHRPPFLIPPKRKKYKRTSWHIPVRIMFRKPRFAATASHLHIEKRKSNLAIFPGSNSRNPSRLVIGQSVNLDKLDIRPDPLPWFQSQNFATNRPLNNIDLVF